MKTRKNPFYQFPATAFAVVAFAIPSSVHAQSWDGGGADASWGTAANWDAADTLPTFGTTSDLSFPTSTGLTSGTTTFLGVGRQVRSLTFGADVDSAFGVIFSNNITTVADSRLTFANTTANSISVLAGSTGNINIGNPTGLALSASPASTLQISGNLTVDHNGSGLLTFSRPISTASAFSLTKNGTGTLQSNNNNLITGALNVNGGRLIANSFTTAGDFNAVSSINLGGGALQYNGTSAGNKTVSPGLNVTAASVLAYNNTDTGVNRSLNFTGATTFDLGASLTVQNISAGTGFANLINITRNITGAGSMIVEGFNNINASTSTFTLGRVAISGVNTGWSGGLEIRKGTAEVYGNYATADKRLGTGDIILGTTGDSFGAGLLLSADSGNGNKAYTNNITVRSGGFRTIRGGSDHTYTFSGNMTLEGDLNIHNGLFFTDKAMSLTGNISGIGDLNVTKGTSGSGTRLSGDNSGWSGDLVISNGLVSLAGAANTSGTGDIFIGETGNTSAASLSFSPSANVTYTNDIIVTTFNTGGSRTIAGNSGSAFSVTLSGSVALNGDLTVDHSWSTADRRISLGGMISGNGGLTITRTGGSLATTATLTGVSNYSGPTTVSSTASLAISSTGSLTSSITVQSGARLGGGGGTSGNLTLNDGAKFFFFYSPTYVPFDVGGTVTVANTFGISSLVGGSQGEVVPWASIPNDTYTLIGTTASTFNTIANFGLANAVVDIDGSGKTVYLQNGGGTSGGGLQLVVTTPGGGNIAPTITDIANQSVPSGGNTGALAFTITDEDVNTVTPSGSSSNTTLVPNANIVFSGSGANRTVTVTPVSGLSGTATITVTLTDNGSLTANDTFVLNVTDNFLSWATANGVTGGVNGDSDNDGVKNLVEYALVNGGELGTLIGNTITFNKRPAPFGTDLTYDIESSTLLTAGSWTVLAKPTPVTENASLISYTFNPSSPAKNFARLKVVQVP